MKKVFSDMSHIAHLWAGQHQESARNSGNFYFEGRNIFSYGGHFIIAQIQECCQNDVLFTMRTYSNTTAKHISVVKDAIRHKNVIYCFEINQCNQDQVAHERNFIRWQELIEENLKKLQRARKPEIYLSDIDHLKHQLERYATYFDVCVPTPITILLSDLSYEGFRKFDDTREARLIAYRKERLKQANISGAKEVRRWLNFEVARTYGALKYDFLRFDKVKNRVETTQKVEIPLEIAKIFHKLVKTDKLKVGDTILNFKVNEIGSIIKIGCHKFRKSYLVKFGNNLPKAKKKLC
jgi:hypothetical protein